MFWLLLAVVFSATGAKVSEPVSILNVRIPDDWNTSPVRSMDVIGGGPNRGGPVPFWIVAVNLDDRAIINSLIEFNGAARHVRMRPQNDWALEERFTGMVSDHPYLMNVWRGFMDHSFKSTAEYCRNLKRPTGGP